MEIVYPDKKNYPLDARVTAPPRRSELQKEAKDLGLDPDVYGKLDGKELMSLVNETKAKSAMKPKKASK